MITLMGSYYYSLTMGLAMNMHYYENTYFKRYGEQSNEYVSKRQVSQVVIGDRPHPFASGYGPYYQPVPGYGDHGYGPVEHGQYNHQQGRNLIQVRFLLVMHQRVVSRDISREFDGQVNRDRGYDCRGDGSHCTRPRRRHVKRGNIERPTLLVANFTALPSRHVCRADSANVREPEDLLELLSSERNKNVDL